MTKPISIKYYLNARKTLTFVVTWIQLIYLYLLTGPKLFWITTYILRIIILTQQNGPALSSKFERNQSNQIGTTATQQHTLGIACGCQTRPTCIMENFRIRHELDRNSREDSAIDPCKQESKKAHFSAIKYRCTYDPLHRILSFNLSSFK